MRTRKLARYPLTFQKACHIKWACGVMGWSQTRAANLIGLNQGTVSHVVHGHRCPEAVPIPIPGQDDLGLAEPSVKKMQRRPRRPTMPVPPKHPFSGPARWP